MTWHGRTSVDRRKRIRSVVESGNLAIWFLVTTATTLTLIWVGAAHGALQDATVPRFPEPLLNMQESRAALFRTALIEFEIFHHDSKSRERFSARYAGSDVMMTRRKPPLSADQPLPARPYTFSDHRVLLTAEGGQWSYIEGSAFVHLYDSSSGALEPGAVFDIRTEDVHPRSSHDAREDFDPARFLERRFLGKSPEFGVFSHADGTVLVTADEPDRSYAWRLDPQKDWYPVYVQMTRDIENYGLAVDEVVSTPGQVGDKWFPREVKYYRNGRLDRTLTVNHVEFDQPHHAPRLLVGDSLGLLVGTNVQHYSEGGWVTAPEMFDGRGVASTEEVGARHVRGELDLTPFREFVRQNKFTPPGCYPRMDPRSTSYAPILLMRRPRLWEDYTRDFIAGHDLNTDQTKQAWEILRSCQKPAYEYLERQSELLGEIDKRRSDQRDILRSQDVSVPEQDLARRKLEAADEDELKVLAPIERIFEDCLKRQLQALLTPEQHESADKSNKREE